MKKKARMKLLKIFGDSMATTLILSFSDYKRAMDTAEQKLKRVTLEELQ